LCHTFLSTFILLQLTWLQAPTKFLIVEEKFKVIRELENKKESDTCREFGLANSTVFGKTKPKLLVRMNGMDREQSDYESLNNLKSVGRCLSDLSKTEVTMYR
jgi:hypothetical protein